MPLQPSSAAESEMIIKALQAAMRATILRAEAAETKLQHIDRDRGEVEHASRLKQADSQMQIPQVEPQCTADWRTVHTAALRMHPPSTHTAMTMWSTATESEDTTYHSDDTDPDNGSCTDSDSESSDSEPLQRRSVPEQTQDRGLQQQQQAAQQLLAESLAQTADELDRLLATENTVAATVIARDDERRSQEQQWLRRTRHIPALEALAQRNFRQQIIDKAHASKKPNSIAFAARQIRLLDS